MQKVRRQKEVLLLGEKRKVRDVSLIFVCTTWLLHMVVAHGCWLWKHFLGLDSGVSPIDIFSESTSNGDDVLSNFLFCFVLSGCVGLSKLLLLMPSHV